MKKGTFRAGLALPAVLVAAYALPSSAFAALGGQAPAVPTAGAAAAAPVETIVAAVGDASAAATSQAAAAAEPAAPAAAPVPAAATATPLPATASASASISTAADGPSIRGGAQLDVSAPASIAAPGSVAVSTSGNRVAATPQRPRPRGTSASLRPPAVTRFATATAGAWLVLADEPHEVVDGWLGATRTLLATIEENTRSEVTEHKDHPCSPGRVIELTGSLHVRYRITLNEDGTFRISWTENYQNVRGKDLVAPDEALAEYVTQDTFTYSLNFLALPVTFSQASNVRYLSNSADVPDFRAHTNVGFTVNANGQLTAVVGNVFAECR